MREVRALLDGYVYALIECGQLENYVFGGFLPWLEVRNNIRTPAGAGIGFSSMPPGPKRPQFNHYRNSLRNIVTKSHGEPSTQMQRGNGISACHRASRKRRAPRIGMTSKLESSALSGLENLWRLFTQGVALGWFVTAPSGRTYMANRLAPPKLTVGISLADQLRRSEGGARFRSAPTGRNKPARGHAPGQRTKRMISPKRAAQFTQSHVSIAR